MLIRGKAAKPLPHGFTLVKPPKPKRRRLSAAARWLKEHGEPMTTRQQERRSLAAFVGLLVQESV